MKIVFYTTPTCPYCKLVREFLKEQGQTWEEVEVTTGASFGEMQRISGQMAVPVIDIDGKVIVGWNKNGIKEALKK